MGDALMKQVMRDWGDLPGNAYKALMVMASCAMDDAEPPTYFGGWERLAITGMGRRDWPADDDETPGAELVRKRHWEAARAALADLKKAGAVSTSRRGRPGVRAEFHLSLDRTNTGKPCVPTQENPAVAQENPAESQENPAPNYQHSQHSQTGDPTSPSLSPHQGVKAPVDKGRLTPAQRAEAQRRADAETAA